MWVGEGRGSGVSISFMKTPKRNMVVEGPNLVHCKLRVVLWPILRAFVRIVKIPYKEDKPLYLPSLSVFTKL